MTERVLGDNLPISYGTAVPLEKEIMVTDLAQKVDGVALNIRTLWRNFITAYPREGRPHVSTLLAPFVEELQLIKQILNSSGVPHSIYHLTYADLGYIFPYAHLKVETTVNQVRDRAEETMALGLVLAAKDLEIQQFRLLIPSKAARIWMVTHHPLDLLNRYQFSSLTLLESRTGTLKRPMDWISKLTSNEEYARLPFNVLTVQVFGDGHFIKGHGIRYRRMLREVAERNGWTPLTTKEKILYDLEKHADKAMAKELAQMFNVTLR